MKILKFGMSKIVYCYCPKNGTIWFYIAGMHSKDADGMEFSEVPEQTALEAAWSGSALF